MLEAQGIWQSMKTNMKQSPSQHNDLVQGKLQEALDTLLNMEKQHRLAEDYTATTACCRAVLDITFDSGDWKLLNENLLVLSKRRSQLRQVRPNSWTASQPARRSWAEGKLELSHSQVGPALLCFSG